MAAPLPEVGLGSIFTVVAALSLVLGLLYATVYLLRRFGPDFGLGMSKGRILELESHLAVGQRKHVAIVRVENRRLVLGVTDHNINLLAELYDDGSNTEEFSRVLEKDDSADSA